MGHPHMSYQTRIQQQEDRLYSLILRRLLEWLRRVKDAVLRAWRQWGGSPDPSAVYEASPFWDESVDLIVEELDASHRAGWEEATESLDIDLDYISTDMFIQSQVAQTKNLLVRIPDEVYNLVFAAISDGINDGDGVDEIAERIDAVLSEAGSENWAHRARLIAITEANRAGNAGAFASGMLAQRLEGVPMLKRWLDSHDARVRPQHRDADGQTVPIDQPFRLGGDQVMYPGDPAGLPETVINCRCSMLIEEA